MQCNRVNNKERLCSFVVSDVDVCAQNRNSMCFGLRHSCIHSSYDTFAARLPGSFSPPPSHLFPLFNSVAGACLFFLHGCHGWVARICQPWEQSSSRSWLPIVEAPGCLRHPTFINFSYAVNIRLFAPFHSLISY